MERLRDDTLKNITFFEGILLLNKKSTPFCHLWNTKYTVTEHNVQTNPPPQKAVNAETNYVLFYRHKPTDVRSQLIAQQTWVEYNGKHVAECAWIQRKGKSGFVVLSSCSNQSVGGQFLVKWETLNEESIRFGTKWPWSGGNRSPVKVFHFDKKLNENWEARLLWHILPYGSECG